jgi:hypothetical protein
MHTPMSHPGHTAGKFQRAVKSDLDGIAIGVFLEDADFKICVVQNSSFSRRSKWLSQASFLSVSELVIYEFRHRIIFWP